MQWALSLKPEALFFGSLLLVAAGGVGVILALHRIVSPKNRESVGMTAAAYMTALGSLFAILTGFLINAEYTTLRRTQDIVAEEASAASRLAWATEGLAGVDSALVQDALATYLHDLDTGEWDALANGDPERSLAVRSLSDLQGVVFNVGSREYVSAASAEGMRSAVSDLTSARRERVAIASQSLPVPLFALSVVAGVALIVNAIAVTLRSRTWTVAVAAGILVIVALDLALILAISAPFQGAFTASRAPIAELYGEVRAGDFLPWIQRS
jgi:hypothetical protein